MPDAITAPRGVSFVMPVYNGMATLAAALEAILAQQDGDARSFEVVAVDDGSTDGSLELLETFARDREIRVLRGRRLGAAAAINLGVRASRHPIVCQVDQDVIVEPGWMAALVTTLDGAGIGAAQGHYLPLPRAGALARVAWLDLELRYGRLGTTTTHVCTGNAAYRREALEAVGLFDETLGYGYDNDMSYRLAAAGYQLAYCPRARSRHAWPETWRGYLGRQYGQGYGRLDLVAKHPRRIAGDSVSPAGMMLRPAVLIAGLAAFGVALGLGAVGRPAGTWVVAGGGLATVLAAERVVAARRAWRRFGDTAAALLLPAAHLARDLAWVLAVLTWAVRRAAGSGTTPEQSMFRREGPPVEPSAPFDPSAPTAHAAPARPTRVLVVVPAHNEARSLPTLIAELRAQSGGLDLLVVDDGSTDGTVALLERLGVRYVRFGERMGVGVAVRAALRLAARDGYDAVVRVDGDGQHPPADLMTLVAALEARHCDLVVGSRTATAGVGHAWWRVTARAAVSWLFSAVALQRVTDPTSGFVAFGPRAIALLGEHHPGGYGEPELRLFARANGLRVVEVPVTMRPRTAGRSTLTLARLAVAGARLLLAVVMVPLRRTVAGRLS